MFYELIIMELTGYKCVHYGSGKGNVLFLYLLLARQMVRFKAIFRATNPVNKST
jgi:hypothetical protein